MTMRVLLGRSVGFAGIEDVVNDAISIFNVEIQTCTYMSA